MGQCLEPNRFELHNSWSNFMCSTEQNMYCKENAWSPTCLEFCNPWLTFLCSVEQNTHSRLQSILSIFKVPANIIAIANNLIEHLCFRLRKHHIKSLVSSPFFLLSANRLNSPLFLSVVLLPCSTLVCHCECCVEGH